MKFLLRDAKKAHYSPPDPQRLVLLQVRAQHVGRGGLEVAQVLRQCVPEPEELPPQRESGGEEWVIGGLSEAISQADSKGVLPRFATTV